LDEAKIQQTHRVLRSVYSSAYDWEPPAEYSLPDITARIRQHVKRWITEWDLRRYFPDYHPEIVTSQISQEYLETADLDQTDDTESQETGDAG
jgi:hypothetical protein